MVATCLMTGAAKYDRTGFNQVHIFPITLKPRDCPNNDGYTIFDITDPDRPRHCFMVSGDEIYSEPYNPTFVEAMAPISASEYLFLYKIQESRYHDDDDSHDGAEHSSNGTDNRRSDLDIVANIKTTLSSHPVLKDLDDYPSIELDALRSAWPEEKFAEAAEVSKETSVEAPSPSSASLRTRAMEEVISSALQSGSDNLSWLCEAALLPDFTNKAYAHLALHPEVVTSPAGFHLLCRVLKDRQEVDLSYFGHLTISQILHILSEIQGSSERITLILPRLQSLTASDVRSIILSSNIVDLRLGYTPGLDLAALTGALEGTKLQKLSHPELFRSSLLASHQL